VSESGRAYSETAGTRTLATAESVSESKLLHAAISSSAPTSALSLLLASELAFPPARALRQRPHLHSGPRRRTPHHQWQRRWFSGPPPKSAAARSRSSLLHSCILRGAAGRATDREHACVQGEGGGEKGVNREQTDLDRQRMCKAMLTEAARRGSTQKQHRCQVQMQGKDAKRAEG